jgi:hypothetical protein
MHLNARIRRQPIDNRHDQPLGKLQITGEARPSPKRKHISIVTDRDASSDFACLLAPIAM